MIALPVGHAGAQSGGRIFFYEGCNGCPAPEGWRVMSGDGQTVRELPDIRTDDFVPSADGSRVVYFRGGLVADDLSFARPVLLAPSVEIGFDSLDPRDPDWSPSGELIAYYGPGPNTTRQEEEGIVLVPSRGGDRTMVPNTWLLTDPSWAPDERRLVAVQPGTNLDPVSRLVVVDRVAGTAMVLLADQPGVQLLAPEWSPDGSQIIYARATDLGPTARLWRVASDGTGARELVSRDVGRGPSHWSPDGQSIAFSAWDGPSTGRLYTVHADGSGVRMLRGSRGMQVRAVGWVSGGLAPLAPKLGKTVVAAVVRGSVRLRRPGSRRFVDLVAEATIPVGSLLDTKRGTVELVSARNTAGQTQSGSFSGGLFQVLQASARNARGLTELRLKGSSFRRCDTATRGAAAAQLSRRTIRRLRASARGRFRTRGRHSAATVRGTVWITADRCDGTLTSVRRGKVAVRDLGRRRTVVVRAGRSYLARAKR